MKTKIGFIVSGLIIIIFATYMLFVEIGEYRKASNIYKNTVKKYVSVSKDIDENSNDEASEEKPGWGKMIDVNISGLQNINEDVIGWIYFENLDINYPILYSGDNNTYLRRSYKGEDIQAGSIFMDGRNAKDFSDVHTIIYGHNMKDLSMFGKLKYYASDKDYVLDHEYFQVITAEKKYRYKIISCKTVADDSAVFTIYKNGDQNFLSFVDNVLQRGSYIEGNYDVKSDDHLITLSTCSGNDRFIVNAVRCDEF